jgi:hypothetical protein
MTPSHPARVSRFTRRDWIGDSILIIASGVALMATVLLPWANTGTNGHFDFSPGKPSSINGVLSTDWGAWILGIGVLVTAIGVVLLVRGPRGRVVQPLALVVALCGPVTLVVAGKALHSILSYYSAGLGVLAAIIIGILMPVIALATALVARILREQEGPSDAVTPAAEADAVVSAVTEPTLP